LELYPTSYFKLNRFAFFLLLGLPLVGALLEVGKALSVGSIVGRLHLAIANVFWIEGKERAQRVRHVIYGEKSSGYFFGSYSAHDIKEMYKTILSHKLTVH